MKVTYETRQQSILETLFFLAIHGVEHSGPFPLKKIYGLPLYEGQHPYTTTFKWNKIDIIVYDCNISAFEQNFVSQDASILYENKLVGTISDCINRDELW